MWLECIGVVSGCCVRRYIYFLILIIPIPLVLPLFCSSIHTSLFILKIFFHSCLLFLYSIAKVAQRTFEIVQKSRSRGPSDIIILTSTSTTNPKTSTCEVPSDILHKLQADFV